MVFISFIMSIFIAIQDPIIQKFTIRIAGGYLSSKTGMDVKIGRLYISPDFTVHIDQFSVKDLKNNDLINAEKLRVRPIMEDIIHGDINIDMIDLRHTQANLITYEGEEKMNLQHLLDVFSSDKEKESNTVIKIKINKINFEDLAFRYWNQNKDDPEKTANHLMDYSNIKVDSILLDMEDIVIIGDSITAKINQLSAFEQSGFALHHLQSNAIVSSSGILLDRLQIQTDNSNLFLDLHLLYPGYQAMSSFVDSVYFDSKITRTEVMLSDLGPFSNALYDMPNRIKIETEMRGPIKDFKLSKLKFMIGKQTRFQGDLALQPLDIFNGQHAINFKTLEYSYNDLANFRIPGASKTIPLPAMLASLGSGTIKGKVAGSTEKFMADLYVTSEIGNVNLDINKHRNQQKNDVIEGHIQAEHLDVGKLANASKTIGSIDLDANVIARLTKKGDVDLDIDGNAHNAYLLGNSIDEISMNGNLYQNQFNGKISIDDDELALDFKGNFDFRDPKALGGNFSADILNADLYKLKLINDDPQASLKATITADMSNINDFNKAEGTLKIRGLEFQNKNGALLLDAFDGSIVNDHLMQKKINLDCDFLEFEMAGKMDFATLATAFKQYVNHYVTIPQWAEELEAFENSGKSSNQDFIVQMTIKDAKPITQLFMPDLSLAKNTYLNGTFTSRSHSLNLTLRSKYLKYNGIKINNIEYRNLSSPRRSNGRLHIDQIILRDSTETGQSSLGLEDFALVTNLRNDSILADILWDDKTLTDHNKATIQTSLVPQPSGGRFNINKADIIINDSLWNINPSNLLEFDSSRIHFSNVELFCGQQRLIVDGDMPNTVEDTLLASFQHFNLSNLNFLMESTGLQIEGALFGEAKVSNIKTDPTLLANININQLGLNNQIFGDATIYSAWDNEKEAINMNVILQHQQRSAIDLSGAFYPNKKDEQLDFKLKLDSLNLGILSPFLGNAIERMQGFGKGTVAVKGSLKKPTIDGTIKVKDGGCKVNFLNTYYTFSPTISINDSLISLTDLSLTDTLGNSALVVGQISHDHLKDFYLDLKMFPTEFLAMSTTAVNNSSFYGDAIATGVVEVKGPVNDLDLKIRARTNKGTVMTIPLGGKNNVKKHDFITFVNRAEQETEDQEEITNKATSKEATSFRIGLDLGVNNNAQIKIALPNNIGNMEARGEGNIKLGVSSTNMSLIGDYMITDGSLSLNIQDLIKRNFTLEPGSTISWTGDPVNGTINATGVYQTKASVGTLGLVDTTNMSSSNIKVECLVHLKNKLMNPDISFSLRLPNATEDMQQAVFSVIDTTNQSVMFTQTIYLLAFNSFNFGGSMDSYGGLISSQLNDWVSKINTGVDINFNYKPGSNISNEEMTVALKTQLFDDRLTIETNFGVIIPANTYAANNTNIVGDFNLDYKITKDGRLSAQVFNRSNYNSIYYQYTYYKMAPFTQGIGLSYSKNFDRFKDFFKKQKNIVPPNRSFSGKNEPNQNITNESSN